MHGAPAASHEPIGFIGLGALGAPMAANLIHAGFPLTLHNRSRRREAFFVEHGGSVVASPAEVARRSGILCLCLSDDHAVETVLLDGDGAAIHGLQAGALVIDFSTISPSTTRRLAQQLGGTGIQWLDAPVTGGTEGARTGSLSVLVGGETADLERARPVLEVIGSRITHLGPVGAGQQAKAVNQVLVAGSYAAVAEALALAERLGLPQEQLVRALQGGAAGSWALEHRSQKMIDDHYPLGFRLALHRKDLAIALAAAEQSGLELPVTSQVAAMEDELMQQGCGDLDVSALARWFRA